MGSCCSSGNNEALNHEEDQARGDLECMLRELEGAEDEKSSMVQLLIKCRGLKPINTYGQLGRIGASGGVALHSINPYVAAYETDEAGENMKFIGKTETKFRDTNPHFVKTVATTFQFSSEQYITFKIYDEPTRHGHHERDPVEIGTGRAKLVDIINSRAKAPYHVEILRIVTHQNVRKPLQLAGRRGKHASKNNDENEEAATPQQQQVGFLTVTAEELEQQEGPKYEVSMEVSCHSLEAKNLFGAGGSDPFLVISRIVDGQFQPIHKTEYYESVLQCEWKTFVVSLERFCKSDFNAWILLEVWDYENNGNHQLIGQTKQTLATLLSRVQDGIELFNHNYRGKRKKKLGKSIAPNKLGFKHPTIQKIQYQKSGILQINKIGIDVSHSFLEFVRSGFEINLTVCVDFSMSNGELHDPTSLHYITDDKRDNEYIKALRAVVGVLGNYDKDQQFPFYGFGARNKNDDSYAYNKEKDKKDSGPPVNQIFPVTGDAMKVVVEKAEGLIDAYWSCLQERIVPAEPTHFAPCLGKVYQMVSGRKDQYQIVLIITDGNCCDIQATTDMIVDSSDEPISIVIIGVGGGNFDEMEALSADEKPLRSSDKKLMVRDIVGFVPFREYEHNPAALQRETLKEIPRQFISWAKQSGIKPIDNEAEEKKSTDRRPKEDEIFLTEDILETKKEEKKEAKKEKVVETEVKNEGWESFSDDDTKKRYYYNNTTGESTWDIPEGYKGYKKPKSNPQPPPQVVPTYTPPVQHPKPKKQLPYKVARRSIDVQPVGVGLDTESSVSSYAPFPNGNTDKLYGFNDPNKGMRRGSNSSSHSPPKRIPHSPVHSPVSYMQGHSNSSHGSYKPPQVQTAMLSYEARQWSASKSKQTVQSVHRPAVRGTVN